MSPLIYKQRNDPRLQIRSMVAPSQCAVLCRATPDWSRPRVAIRISVGSRRKLHHWRADAVARPGTAEASVARRRRDGARADQLERRPRAHGFRHASAHVLHHRCPGKFRFRHDLDSGCLGQITLCTQLRHELVKFLCFHGRATN